jgi:hypothetical protein
VLSGDLRRRNNEQTLNTDTNAFHDGEYVHFTQLFYWRHYYHEEETNFYALQRMVFVDGLEEPVINEEYQGQARQPDGSIVGMRRNPIQVLTLTYISDDPLPPSDSTIGRPQVDELEASRDAMVQQRKHSIPIRWFDPNRVSANTRALLEKGTYQGLVPTNGPGDRAIGEVARATYPAERFEFDRVINSDLSEGWQVGSNQAGNFASGERSASEARIIQQNFQTRVGQERDKVTRFLVNISECIAGLIAIHGGEYGLPKEIAGQVTYDVRVDSTVRMDAESRIAQLDAFVNKWAQSGFLNPKVIAQEWADLAGIPPEAIVDPQPKGPEPVKLSVSKAEDLASPLFLACLMATNQAPSPEHIAAAVRLLNEASMGIVPIIPPQAPESEPVGDNVKRPGIQNADWQEQPRINKRDEDGGA